MKRFVKRGFASICIVLAAISCTWEDSVPDSGGKARLVFNFINSKAGESNPDDFVLSVFSAQGDSCYLGRFGDRPSEMSVKPGTYLISACSQFEGPAFNAPQYGDEVCVEVKKQETATVNLRCKLVNSGISLTFSDEFRKEYPSSPLVLYQNGKGLDYTYSEKGVAYFNPGKVFLIYNDEVLLYKELTKGQVTSLSLDAVKSSAGFGISIQVNTDTPVVEESMVVDDCTFSISEARLMDDGLTASVSGYITGAVKNSKFVAAGNGMDVSSNIVISTSRGDNTLEKGMPVELKGTFKTELNLVDHPELAGRKITIKGTILPYFGTKGLKNVSSYHIE